MDDDELHQLLDVLRIPGTPSRSVFDRVWEAIDQLDGRYCQVQDDNDASTVTEYFTGTAVIKATGEHQRFIQTAFTTTYTTTHKAILRAPD